MNNQENFPFCIGRECVMNMYVPIGNFLHYIASLMSHWSILKNYQIFGTSWIIVTDHFVPLIKPSHATGLTKKWPILSSFKAQQ